MLYGHGPAVEGAVVDAPALHPLHGVAQLLEFGLLLLILLQLQVEPGLLFIHVVGIVAGIKLRVALGDFNDPVCHLVNKIPVVGNGEDRALEGIDVLLQPLHAVQIQMVGGLVQQQNVRLFQQQPGQVHPGFFTTGQAGKVLNPLLRGDAQAVADFVHFHVHVVAAAGLEAVGQGVVFLQLGIGGTVGHFAFQQLHLLTNTQKVRVGRAQHVLHGIARGELGNLGDEAQLFIGIDVDFAGIVVHLAGEDVEKGGFSAAVAAQNCHALPFLNFKGQVFQQIFSDDEEFCQIGYLDIDHVSLLTGIP